MDPALPCCCLQALVLHCGSLEHVAEVFETDVADAALAASLFHYDELSVQDVKVYLQKKGIPVRL